MIGYASRTGTRRNLSELQSRGWRILVAPDQMRRYPSALLPVWNDGTPARYMLDNGAWSSRPTDENPEGLPFDADAFLRAMEVYAEGADLIVLPDIVMGGQRSLDLSLSWHQRMPDHPWLLPVQDGMTGEQIRAVLPDGVGIFVGGSTEWKEATARAWGLLCRAMGGRWLHVARVNSARRIQICHEAQADSIDGTCLTRFAVKAPLIDGALKNPKPHQTDLLWRLAI